MRFQHLNVPLHWETFYTKYPEGYTIVEALINWIAQVDSMADNVNNWNDYLDDFTKKFDAELQGKVSTVLSDWQDSGFLDVIISEALQTQIDTVEDGLNTNTALTYDKPTTFTQAPKFTQLKQLVFGQEHLHPFHMKIGNTSLKVVFSGDSTTANYGLAVPAEWGVDNAFKKMAKYKGFTNITTANNGQSGMSTEHWNRDFYQNDLNAAPDLLVLRWGINDPAYDNSLVHLPDNFIKTGRRTAQDFKNSLYSGLQKIRSARPANDLSIVLMTPNSTSDDSSFRNEEWHEEINGIIRQAARDFQCCFIDTYRYLQDSRYQVTYMDVIGAGHIHPLDMMNLYITDLTFKTVFPDLFVMEYNAFGKSKTIPLSNDWTAYPGLPGLNYYRENHFTTQLYGTLDNGTRTAGTVVGTSPVKPTHMQQLIAAGEQGLCRYYITTSGEIFISSVPEAGWISLDGCSYING